MLREGEKSGKDGGALHVDFCDLRIARNAFLEQFGCGFKLLVGQGAPHEDIVQDGVGAGDDAHSDVMRHIAADQSASLSHALGREVDRFIKAVSAAGSGFLQASEV